MSFISLRGALGAAALVLVSAPAFAHATLAVTETRANAAYRAVVVVPHGCGSQATHTVTVAIPEGMVDVKPMPKAGWTLETRKGAYAKTYTLFGKPVSEGVREVIWRGGNLEDGHFDEFVFRGRFDGELAGKTVPVPVTQTCATSSVAWTEVAAPGQDPHALKTPAPTVKVLAANASAAPAAPVSVSSAWTAATPAGAKVAGGYAVIANATANADRLVGGSFEAAGRVEVHEMTDVAGVMRMREVTGGLPVPANGQAELKPGGYHLMFMDLKRQLKEGETLKGTLVFEKAGAVPVEFAVRPLGSKDAGAGGHHNHH